MIVTGPAAVDSSLTVKRDTTATRQQVWDVVADGWTYSQWVVGNSRMRAVEPDWPAVGSKIHHTIGIWPATINDETVVESCTPLEELVLLARTRPFGDARITLRLYERLTGAASRWPRCRSAARSTGFHVAWRWRRRFPATVNARGGWRLLRSVARNPSEPGPARMDVWRTAIATSSATRATVDRVTRWDVLTARQPGRRAHPR